MYIKISNLTKSFKMFKRSAGLKGAFKSFLIDNILTSMLKNISIEINKGEIVGILGENGAGKTTLIKLMVGYYILLMVKLSLMDITHGNESMII